MPIAQQFCFSCDWLLLANPKTAKIVTNHSHDDYQFHNANCF